MKKTSHFGVVFSECLRGQKSNTLFIRQVAQVARSKLSIRPLTSYSLRNKRSKPQFIPYLEERARKMSRVPIEPQRVDAPLTQSATFLVVSIEKGSNGAQEFSPEAIKTIRSVLASLDDIAKNVSSECYQFLVVSYLCIIANPFILPVRDLNASFACTVGIGATAWDSITRFPRPSELHIFPEVKGAVHTAPSTPGDLLFHIRSERRDLCFEFERQLLSLLGSSISVVDETTGFRYFDVRDLLGFVDGTANPVGPAVPDSVLVTQQDVGESTAGSAIDSAVGGSYIVIQKYLHDMTSWRALKTEQQESIIGRTKFDNEELDDAAEGQQLSHKSLATIEDDAGEYDILRDNMPFGAPGKGEFGTYFIGYSRRLWVIERMLERMFVGVPEGKHDRLLDFSTAVTGNTFFAPSASLLASLGDDE